MIILNKIGLPKTFIIGLGISLDSSEILVPLLQLKLHISLFYSSRMEILVVEIQPRNFLFVMWNI